ncbi:MAG: Ig-like domain-containing protein, partial [Treponema sp.]|nr:Ig-like domain-containing protein [Treponema sp.]
MKKTIQRLSFLLVLALSILVSSCDSLMSGNNFFDTISDEVKYANAPVISVYVRYPNRTMGETSPNGNSKQKVDIPFSVTAVDSTEFKFYKWAAFSSTDSKYSTIRQYSYVYESEEAYEESLGRDELGEEEVVFEDPRSEVTTAKVLHERNDVFIMPICVRRPYIASTNPVNGAVEVVKNQTIDIVFSKPMNPDFLVNADGTLNKTYVSIEAFTQAGEIYIPGGDIENFLPRGKSMQAKLSTSKKTLTISLPAADSQAAEDQIYWPRKSYGITVSYQAEDLLGAQMSTDGYFTFSAGTELDSISPRVMELEVGTNTLKKHTTNMAIPRVGNTLNVRVLMGDKTKESDATFTENNVGKIGYKLEKLQSPTDTLNLSASTILTYDNLEYPYAPGFVASDDVELNSTQSVSGTTFPIIMSSLDEGLWKLTVWGIDKTGNSGKNAANLTSELSTTASQCDIMYIYFIKDTKFPVSSECREGIVAQSDDAPYGWFNATSLSTMKIKETAADAIKDSPNASGICKPFRSPKLWWSFYVGDNPDSWKSSLLSGTGTWLEIPATPTLKPLNDLLGSSINSNSIAEGDVSIYTMFKDDVGNISANYATLNSIKFDRTKPAIGTMEWITPTDVPAGFTSGNVLGNDTLLAIPYTESLSGVKKIAIEVQPPSGAAGIMPCKMAFDDTSFKAYLKNSEGAYVVRSSTKALNANGVQELIFDTPVASSTTSTYMNTLYLENLKIADSMSYLVNGDYTVKVKFYDSALNVSDEKNIIISVDTTAPVVQKVLVEDVKKFTSSAGASATKYFVSSDSYDATNSYFISKVKLDITVKEQTSGLYKITLANAAYVTNNTTVTVTDSSGNVINAPYEKNTSASSRTITFTTPRTVRDTSDTGYVTVKLNNVELSRPDGSKDILVTVEDCAGLNDDNDHKLRFEGDSAEYDEVWGDYSNRSPSVPASFVVKGESAETYPDGYAKTTNLAKATLGLSSFTESGLKKIKLTGAKANHTWGGITDTRVYLGTVTSGAGAVSLAYSIEDGGTTIVLNNPIVSSSAVTLTFTNLELTSTTQGSNTLSAKYEYLTGWESPAKTTTVIYDTVAPVIGSSTESMTWVVKDDASEIPGVSSSATINGQYLVIPVTETNSGVRKIKIEVKKENTEGNMVATTAASCASVAYVGYGTAGTSRVGATTLSSSYWSKSGNELTILDPVNYGKAAYYYIRGIKISDTTSVAEGNYTLHVTLYDYAGNVSGEKTIDMCNDHTSPVVKDSWFDGVVNNASSLSAPRTYTTHSENNTLFIKVEEGGSGIQTIYLHHYFGWDPYNNTLPSCRTIATTSNTKLYKSLDNGATFTEVPCTTGGTSPSYYLKVSNENAIRSTAENDVILKITGLEILATDYADRCAASVSVYMYDFAQNQSSWDTTHNNDKDNPTLAAIAEDRDQADIDQATLTITDSEKVLQGENLVDESGTYAAYTGYTNNPLVNIKFVANEYQHRPSPTSSGIRAFVLEGAKFTEKTVLQWREMKGDYSYGNSSTVNADAHFNSRTLNDQFTAVYNGSKDSIAEVPFAYNTNKFYLVGDNILVVETPISTGTSYNSAPNYFYINYVQLTNTSSDGSKQVKLKIYDTAGTYLKADGTLNEAINTSRPNADSSWPNNHEGSGSITYCATAPTITVNDTAKSDPATITAANIQTLMPTTNGLQAYAEGTTVWTFSHSTQGNRNGSNSTPLGNGVYLYNSYCPYFDLDITPSTAANLLYYKWTNSETVPTSWNTTNSSYKVDVNFPTSGDVSANSVSAKDIYLHVADYAGNVTTKKMSQCQWINETVQDAWPKRKDDTGKKMENGVYYLESDGFYATDIPRLTVTLPAGTSGDVKVYIPTDWFNKVCDSGAPIYGYAMGNHTRYDEGHTDISKAKRDATGPYLEIPQSYITEATAQSTNYAEFYFYVYDAVGQDLTAVVRVTVDSTPPVLELGVLRDSGEYPSGTSSGMKTKWEGSSYVNSTKTRFNVESDGSRYIRQYVDSTQVSTTKGASAANPIVLYVDTNNPEIMLWTNSMDVLKFTCSVDGAEASEIEIDQTTSTSTDLNTNYVRISPTLTETGAMYKFSAVDKGANESSIYIKAYWDH